MLISRKHWDMIDQIKVLLKSVTGEACTPKAIWKLVYTAIGYVSSFFAAAVLLKDLTGYDILERLIKGHWKTVLIVSLLSSCLHNRKKVNCCKKVSNCDMQIAISVKDIFQNRTANSYIIPTNTFFRTQMDNEYISPNSVQGRFQLKYFNGKLHDLDVLIIKSLNSQEIKGFLTSDCFGPVIKYPIGTVAKIDRKGKHFYFVAINDVNKYGKPIGQSIEQVSIALTAVADVIKRMGHYDNLCIPLLGSGRAAIQGATKETVFQQTVDFFIQCDEKLASKLIISVNPKDYLDEKIDLTRMEKYLDYRCEFGKMITSVPCKKA